MDCHREDINWQKEECILLRVGLQENEGRTAELSVRGEQMSRRLCRCADHQGPPISAVGSPLPPTYARSPSPEFHTPPIEVHPCQEYYQNSALFSQFLLILCCTNDFTLLSFYFSTISDHQ